jgi:hypothetical protein
MRRQIGVTWRELLTHALAARGPYTVAASPDWRHIVQVCRAHPDCCTLWETSFLAQLAGYTRRPSDRQLAVLAGIAAKVRAGARCQCLTPSRCLACTPNARQRAHCKCQSTRSAGSANDVASVTPVSAGGSAIPINTLSNTYKLMRFHRVEKAGPYRAARRLLA